MSRFDIFRRVRHSSLAFAIGIAAGCAGPQGDVLVRVPVSKPATTVAIAALPSTTFSISRFDLRRGTGELPGRIGERKTVGNISLGMVTIDPPPDVLLTSRISSQLEAAGHRKVDHDAAVGVSGTVRTFEFHTDVTMLYWDMVVSVAAEIKVAGAASQFVGEYAEVCQQRTYVFPTGDLIEALVVQCVDGIAVKFANDGRVAEALKRLAR